MLKYLFCEQNMLCFFFCNFDIVSAEKKHQSDQIYAWNIDANSNIFLGQNRLSNFDKTNQYFETKYMHGTLSMIQNLC